MEYAFAARVEVKAKVKRAMPHKPRDVKRTVCKCVAAFYQLLHPSNRRTHSNLVGPHHPRSPDSPANTELTALPAPCLQNICKVTSYFYTTCVTLLY